MPGVALERFVVALDAVQDCVGIATASEAEGGRVDEAEVGDKDRDATGSSQLVATFEGDEAKGWDAEGEGGGWSAGPAYARNAGPVLVEVVPATSALPETGRRFGSAAVATVANEGPRWSATEANTTVREAAADRGVKTGASLSKMLLRCDAVGRCQTIASRPKCFPTKAHYPSQEACAVAPIKRFAFFISSADPILLRLSLSMSLSIRSTGGSVRSPAQSFPGRWRRKTSAVRGPKRMFCF